MKFSGNVYNYIKLKVAKLGPTNLSKKSAHKNLQG